MATFIQKEIRVRGIDKLQCNSKPLFVEQYARNSQDAIVISVAEVSYPGILAPKMPDDNEREPVSRAKEGGEEATIISDYSEGSQQEKDAMESQAT